MTHRQWHEVTELGCCYVASNLLPFHLVLDIFEEFGCNGKASQYQVGQRFFFTEAFAILDLLLGLSNDSQYRRDFCNRCQSLLPRLVWLRGHTIRVGQGTVAAAICKQVVDEELKVFDLVEAIGRANPTQADEPTVKIVYEYQDFG